MHEYQEAAKLEALQAAAAKGWEDIRAGRYSDIADDQLDDFIGELGRKAVIRVG